MTASDIPEGFERQTRRSPLTDPWEPIYSKPVSYTHLTLPTIYSV